MYHGPFWLDPPNQGYGLFTNVLGHAPNPDLLLATAVHIVVLVKSEGKVAVLAFAAIELVPLPIPLRVYPIVAIPAVEDIIALTADQDPIITVAPVDEVV